MKQVMKRAWELAKMGVKKFGGKVREYLASSLSIAWEEIKNMSEKKKTIEIRFSYTNPDKHWCAEISGSDMQYKLQRGFLDFIEDENKNYEIVYTVEEGKYYQLKRFNSSTYYHVVNSKLVEVTEKEIMDHFNAPEHGMSKEKYNEMMNSIAFEKTHPDGY